MSGYFTDEQIAELRDSFARVADALDRLEARLIAGMDAAADFPRGPAADCALGTDPPF